MPTDTAHRFTAQACRTATGTQVHAADPHSSRTHCGSIARAQLSRRDLLAAHAHGSLCAKCWPGLLQAETAAEAETFCDRVDAAWAASAAELDARNARLDAEQLAQEAAEREAEAAAQEAKCPTCGHAAHGANSWCMAGTETPRFAGEREGDARYEYQAFGAWHPSPLSNERYAARTLITKTVSLHGTLQGATLAAGTTGDVEQLSPARVRVRGLLTCDR